MVSEAKEAAIVQNSYVARTARSEKKRLTHDDFQVALHELLKGSTPSILKKAIEQANNGDKDARTWLYERAYGKPVQGMQINTTVDHKYSGQVNIAVLTAKMAEELKEGKL